MEVNKYNEKYFKKTDIRFNTMIDCLEFLVRELKHYKGTNAKVEFLEKEKYIQELKQDLSLIDPTLEKIYNPKLCITLNGHHSFFAKT
jgi:hypothetical protein